MWAEQSSHKAGACGTPAPGHAQLERGACWRRLARRCLLTRPLSKREAGLALALPQHLWRHHS